MEILCTLLFSADSETQEALLSHLDSDFLSGVDSADQEPWLLPSPMLLHSGAVTERVSVFHGTGAEATCEARVLGGRSWERARQSGISHSRKLAKKQKTNKQKPKIFLFKLVVKELW